MGIIIPADLELLDVNALIGHTPGDSEEPLHTLARRANWHYATHGPALVAVNPVDQPALQQDFRQSAYASRDGLAYTTKLAIYSPVNGNVTLTIQERTAVGAFGNVAGFPQAAAMAAGTVVWITVATPLLSTTRFMKVHVAGVGGINACQVQHWSTYPTKIGAIAAGKKASGFKGYEDAALTAVAANSPIHTEYFNRTMRNFQATVSDRRQCIAAYSQDWTVAGEYRSTNVGQKTVHEIFMGVSGLAGRSETDVTVRAYAVDSGGAPEGRIVVGQSNKDATGTGTLPCDSAWNETTLTLIGDAPVLYARVIDPNGLVDVKSISVEWQPTIGTALNLIQNPAPPPRLEYLAELDTVGLEACVSTYCLPGLHFDYNLSGATYWHWGWVIPPGVQAIRIAATDSRDHSSQAVGGPEMWNTDGGVAPDDKVVFIHTATGAYASYPDNLSVAWGADNYQTVPDVGAGGTNRKAEITADRETQFEVFYGRYMAGIGGLPQTVSDLSTV